MSKKDKGEPKGKPKDIIIKPPTSVYIQNSNESTSPKNKKKREGSLNK